MLRAAALVLLVSLAMGCQERDMGWPRYDFAANVEMGPQIACVTQRDARVVWRTLSHVRGDVEARVRGGEWRVCRGGLHSGRDHDVELAALSPDTLVEYRLLHDGQPIGDVHRFRTALKPGASGFTFAVIGDTGSGGADQYAVGRRLEALNPSFVLHVGDMAYDHGTRTEAARRHFVPFRDSIASRPWYIAWGNHDVMTNGGADLRPLFRFPSPEAAEANRYYAFNWGDARMWALDMTTDWAPESDQMKWFRADLEKCRQRWKFVFMHYPPYAASPYARSFRRRWERLRAELCPLLEQHGVDIVFSGHSHGYERTYPVRAGKRAGDADGPDFKRPGAPIYVISGGGGKRLNKAGRDWWTAVYERRHQVCAVRVNGSRLVLRSVGRDGEELDRITIEK